MNQHTLVLASAMALAQPLLASAQAGTNDPALPRQAVPALRYDSAFTDYKPWRDTKPGDWRAVNDALAKEAGQPAGGHAGHGAAPPRPAVAPAPSGRTASGAAPADASAPAGTNPNAHDGHGGRK